MKNFISVATTEEEQVEQIKKWIKENLFSIIAGVVIGFGGIFGVDLYKNYQQSQNLEARISYMQGKNSGNNAYNLQNNMISAKNKVAIKDYNGAIADLKSVNADNLLQDVKNIALAKIYLEQKKLGAAINLLENNNLNSSKHLLADVYLAQGQKSLAIETYTLAKDLTQNLQIKAIINIKINDLK